MAAYDPSAVATSLITLAATSPTQAMQQRLYSDTMTLLDVVYGRDSQQALDLRTSLEAIYGKNARNLLFAEEPTDVSAVCTALLALCDDDVNGPTLAIQQQVYQRTLTLYDSVYGPGSPQEADLRNQMGLIVKRVNNLGMQQIRQIDALKGAVTAIQADVAVRKIRWVETLKGAILAVQDDIAANW